MPYDERDADSGRFVDQFWNLVDAYEDHDLPTLRNAAYVVALQRVVESAEESGVWP